MCPLFHKMEMIVPPSPFSLKPEQRTLSLPEELPAYVSPGLWATDLKDGIQWARDLLGKASLCERKGEGVRKGRTSHQITV